MPCARRHRGTRLGRLRVVGDEGIDAVHVDTVIKLLLESHAALKKLLHDRQQILEYRDHGTERDGLFLRHMQNNIGADNAICVPINSMLINAHFHSLIVTSRQNELLMRS